MVLVFDMADFMRQYMDHILWRGTEGQRDIRAKNTNQASAGERIGKVYRDGFDMTPSAQGFILLKKLAGYPVNPVSTKE